MMLMQLFVGMIVMRNFWKEKGDKSDDEARVRIMEVFPTLKRWKMT